MSAALLAIARAIGRLASALLVRGPVSKICCLDGPDPILVAVIWGRLWWRPLRGGWLASKWVPLALPGEELEPAKGRSGGVETRVSLGAHRRKTSRGSKLG